MDMYIYIALGVAIGFVVALIVFLLTKKQFSGDSSQLEAKLAEIFPKVLQNANEQLVLLANEKLQAEKQDIKTDLQNKKTSIEDLIKRIHQELEQSNKRTEKAELERVGSFRELKQEMENNRRITEQLSATTEGLKKVLSNNQLRGQFGEQVAEELLRMVGFVNGVDYQHNKILVGAETRPDFTIFLPDGVKINIDVKFPYANLQKMTETQDEGMKREYVKLFEKDIKDKIKQVTSREYINPEDNTVDFVIMFIPNEMIFSYIYEKMGSVWEDGMKQKVIFAGPFNFTAILRLIRQSYSNFKYQNNVRNIITYIKIFEEEFRKYNQEFVKIGDRLESLNDQYAKVDSTRTKQLIRSVDKIVSEDNKADDVSSAIPAMMDPLISPAANKIVAEEEII
ncbi:MAG: hypothetical protein ACD_30C00052G0026 [uncultured bacterium]|uniref:Recombinase RmuC n=4 Tax=Microgenomates group TaxID=1794810 RepID=A0A1F5K3F7_9BACT|nr:MAG: hypothetical protein ACD_30C00052G0026 [uncultured bacterium]KKQ14807.1 MAG: hypothetical protein US28_C0029G0032 [Candidatus Daviesbacteria bacterium GW2011_GWA1_36_8]KKQ74754.1 MAG: hypothetical protein US96_C0026G0002 [Candidatus Woesebacteria bacterium GW2011_GWB1_38_5b]OGE17432.1 MAG: hypothetical protein A2858_00070 [Candidatus Daviesbacteria bacterium RIFCSPHIGHO2_01_FULL_36_37]OGE35310.1 MAG: hypothetical protein A3E66_00430 [Candidatus Daviesbacteria bacterium RIFCSPHIGHO2_12_F